MYLLSLQSKREQYNLHPKKQYAWSEKAIIKYILMPESNQRCLKNLKLPASKWQGRARIENLYFLLRKEKGRHSCSEQG